jgi:WD40 repeat protein
MAIEYFPITIGCYDHWIALSADSESRTVEELLADFGSEPVWWDAPDIRDASAVEARLREWAEVHSPGNTFLYWLGHGWSDGGNAALAHSRSPQELDTGGIPPEVFYRYLRRRASVMHDAWAIMVFDTCGSKRFVEQLSSRIYDDQYGPRRFLLIGSAGDGTAKLGHFGRILKFVLTKTFGGVQKVELGLLGHELRRVLGDDSIVISEVPASVAIQRSVPVITGTHVDNADELHSIISSLSKDEQSHFIPKAQGAELGEFSWFFEGRDSERIRVSTWLRHSQNGMLVITGVPGSGKSAFLGDLVVQSRPELRRALLRRELIKLVPPNERPPDQVFTTIIHLTGSTPTQFISRIAYAMDIDEPPRDRDVHTRTMWLIAKIGARPFALMVDALDESQQPIIIARDILRPLSEAPNVRVLVGTRISTSEGPDRSATDQDLLDALGVPAQSLIRLHRDPAAISRYVFRRLVKALSDDEGLEDFSNRLSGNEREFLFARLAVRELIEEPRLLKDPSALDELLRCSHGELFARAVARFSASDEVFGVLLTALALAQGRGLPIVHGIWMNVAQSLSESLKINDHDIDRLIGLAAPYLILDVENDETVYRLAHRTFSEKLTNTPHDVDRNRRITKALVEMAIKYESADEWPSYISHYLYNHAAAGGPKAWLEVDRLNPRQVAVSGLRYHFGQLRPELAGIIGAQHLLLELSRERRTGVRQLAMTQYGRLIRPTELNEPPQDSWEVRWARMRQHPIHLVLSGHSDIVTAVVSFEAASGKNLIASASHDRTIRIWDPSVGTEVGRITTKRRIKCLTCFTKLTGETLLVSGAQDGTICIWDPVSLSQIGKTLKGHVGPVNTIISIAGRDGHPLLVSGGADRTIRLWDPRIRGRVYDPLNYHAGIINCLCAFAGPNGRIRIVSGDDNGSALILDPMNRAVLDTLTGHSGPVTAISVFRNRDMHPILCVSSEEETVLWDSTDGSTSGFLTEGHTSPILGSVAYTDSGGGALFAACSADGLARIWEPMSCRLIGQVLSGHQGEVYSICVFEQEDRQPVIATAGQDGTIRVWEPSAARREAFVSEISGPVIAICCLNNGPYISAVDGGSEEISVWDRFTGEAKSKSGFRAKQLTRQNHVFPTSDGGSITVEDRKLETHILLKKIAENDERVVRWMTTQKWSKVVAVSTPNGQPLLAVSFQFIRAIRLFDPEVGEYLDFTLRVYNEAWTGAATTFIGRDGETRFAAALQDHEDGGIAISSLSEENQIRFRTNNQVAITALTSMGNLLIGGGHDGILYAWDPIQEGERWSFQLGAGIRSLDSVGRDIYVGTDEGIAALILSDRMTLRPNSGK